MNPMVMPSPCLSQAGDARGTAPKPRTRQVCCRYSFLFGIPSVWSLAAACQAGRHQTNAAIVSPVSAKVKDSFPQTGGLTAQGFPPGFIYPAQNPVNFSFFPVSSGPGASPPGGAAGIPPPPLVRGQTQAVPLALRAAQQSLTPVTQAATQTGLSPLERPADGGAVHV